MYDIINESIIKDVCQRQCISIINEVSIINEDIYTLTSLNIIYFFIYNILYITRIAIFLFRAKKIFLRDCESTYVTNAPS